MASDSTARILAVVGIVLNIIGLGVELFLVLSIYLFFILIWGVSYFVFTGMMLLVGFICSCVLPIIGYSQIGPATKGRAGTLLIFSGVIDVVLSSFSGYFGTIGGILVLVAGALVYSWEPHKAQPSQPLPWEAAGQPVVSAPDNGAPGGFVTPKGARFCVSCGTQLEGNELSCPNCGTPVR
jgi:hypothetical protein